MAVDAAQRWNLIGAHERPCQQGEEREAGAVRKKFVGKDFAESGHANSLQLREHAAPSFLAHRAHAPGSRLRPACAGTEHRLVCALLEEARLRMSPDGLKQQSGVALLVRSAVRLLRHLQARLVAAEGCRACQPRLHHGRKPCLRDSNLTQSLPELRMPQLIRPRERLDMFHPPFSEPPSYLHIMQNLSTSSDRKRFRSQYARRKR